jgi:hypothetical protein
MDERRGLGWEVGLLLTLLAAGGVASAGAVALAVGLGVAGRIPGTGGDHPAVELVPARVVLGLCLAAAFLAVAWLVRPRDPRVPSDLHSGVPDQRAE